MVDLMKELGILLFQAFSGQVNDYLATPCGIEQERKSIEAKLKAD
jgi:hypothetical protein